MIIGSPSGFQKCLYLVYKSWPQMMTSTLMHLAFMNFLHSVRVLRLTTAVRILFALTTLPNSPFNRPTNTFILFHIIADFVCFYYYMSRIERRQTEVQTFYSLIISSLAIFVLRTFSPSAKATAILLSSGITLTTLPSPNFACLTIIPSA